MSNWYLPPERDVRDVILDWSESLSFEQSMDTWRRWANDVAGRDRRLAALCRDMQEAHAAITTYCKSVRNEP